MAPRKRGLLPFSADESRSLKTIGRKIGEFAAQRKISVERLAYEAGVSKGYLYDIVKGKGNPSLIILFRIASALEIPPHLLLK